MASWEIVFFSLHVVYYCWHDYGVFGQHADQNLFPNFGHYVQGIIYMFSDVMFFLGGQAQQVGKSSS